MNNRASYDPGPVTIGDLRRDGKALEIGCMNCNRHEYFDAHVIRLTDDLPVPRAASRLRCSRCGFRNTETAHRIWARPDARVAGRHSDRPSSS